MGSRKWSRLIGITFYFLLLTFYLSGCAPRVAPPPLYKGQELSLDEIIRKVSGDIEILKAIADIKIERDNELYDSVNASVIIKRPGWMHVRIYKFGMLVRDFVVRDGELFVLTGKGDARLKEFAREFYNSVFWWDDIKDAFMYVSAEEPVYVIRKDNKTVYVDRTTLLPLRQEIRALNRDMYILYEEPKDDGGFWYPSLLKIYAGDFKFTVRVNRLVKNPALGEFDFKVPAQS